MCDSVSSDLCDYLKKQFLSIIDRPTDSDKPLVIIWDDDVISKMGLITDFGILRNHNVHKMFAYSSFSESRLLSESPSNPIYVMNTKNINDLCSKISRSSGTMTQCIYRRLIVIPEVSSDNRQCLTDSKFCNLFTDTDELPLIFVPIDRDVFTCFDDKLLHGYLIHDIYGSFTSVFSNGLMSKKLCEMICRNKLSITGPNDDSEKTLVVVDRSYDFLSCLVQDVSYESLLNANYSINMGSISVDRKIIDSSLDDSLTSDVQKLHLNSNDPVFNEIRHMPFESLGPILTRKTEELIRIHNEKHTLSTIGSMKSLVGKIPYYRQMTNSLNIHTQLGHVVKKMVESEDFCQRLNQERDIILNSKPNRLQESIVDSILEKKDLNF
ncbi:hypothetical protein GJ496_001945, partial [Pomphorhynchus laevis]